jgi:hypothetical protein
MGMESKKRYDSTHALAQIDVGDVVGVAVTPLNNMLPYITGPYVVTEIDITRNFVSGHGWIDKEAKMAKVHVSRVFKMDMSRTDKKEYVAFTAPPGVAVQDEVVAHRTEKGRRVYKVKWVRRANVDAGEQYPRGQRRGGEVMQGQGAGTGAGGKVNARHSGQSQEGGQALRGPREGAEGRRYTRAFQDSAVAEATLGRRISGATLF